MSKIYKNEIFDLVVNQLNYLFKDKYKVKINQKTIERVKNYFK